MEQNSFLRIFFSSRNQTQVVYYKIQWTSREKYSGYYVRIWY